MSARRTLIHATAVRMDAHDGKPDADEDRPKRKERKVGGYWEVALLGACVECSCGAAVGDSGQFPGICHHLTHCGTSACNQNTLTLATIHTQALSLSLSLSLSSFYGH